MNIRFIKSNEKKKVVELLDNYFGINKIPYLLIESGKEKIRAFSGSLAKEQLEFLSQTINIEIIGTYLIRRESETDLRLSFDAPIILKDSISKGILEINEEQFNSWIRGNDLEIQFPKGAVIIKYKSDFVGCGKSNGDKIFNYVPKDRRLRK